MTVLISTFSAPNGSGGSGGTPWVFRKCCSSYSFPVGIDWHFIWSPVPRAPGDTVTLELWIHSAFGQGCGFGDHTFTFPAGPAPPAASQTGTAHYDFVLSGLGCGFQVRSKRVNSTGTYYSAWSSNQDLL
jgi:hypothetical protein